MSEGTMACPKCGAEAREAATACARCGLAVERFDAWRAPEDPPELAEAWHACRAAWEDDAAHDRAIDVAAGLGALPALSRRYGEALRERAGDPIATRRLSALAMLVEAGARGQLSEDRSRGAAWAMQAASFVIAAAVLVGAVWLFVRAVAAD